jgi:CubicO group peptidase (beta-lactamase class C family)
MSLPRSTPEEQGVSQAALRIYVDALDRSDHELHSLMVLRHGQVITEGWWAPFRATDPHLLFSLSKSFTSTAVGLAVEAGLLSVEDRVVSFFPDELPADVSDNLAAMEVRHLLTMTTGHDADSAGKFDRGPNGNWLRSFLSLDVPHEPGTFFLYDSGASYTLSAIVQKLTGQPVLEYLRPRLFDPLGISEGTWATSPQGINAGGWGLSLTTESIAKFGQLYLQRGRWQDRQLVPAEWVATATSAVVPNNQDNPDWHQGYGYQFWQSRHGYRGDGAFGQFCLVFPEHDAVVAMTGATADMQGVLDLTWAHLLPAFDDTPLADRLGGLALPEPRSADPAPDALRGKSYAVDSNNIGLDSVEFGDSVTLVVDGQRIDCGVGDRQPISHPQLGTRVIASGRADGDSYEAVLRFVETPYQGTIILRPDGDSLRITTKSNVGFGATDEEVTGRPTVTA